MKKPLRDGTVWRRERLRLVKEIAQKHLNENGGIMSLKKLLAFIDWDLGLSPRTAIQYIDTLSLMDVYTYDQEGDFITFTKNQTEASS